MFLPTTKKELQTLGWEKPDVILITGDAYIDSPFSGVAVIGRILMNAGYRTAIIAQPDIQSDIDIKRLGEPNLFWGISGGCVDSMVANYTASKKRRKSDDYTPGGQNVKRPDRAVIRYANLIRQYYKQTVPIVLGGIEASLRRISHYDFWSNKLRQSVLLDAKADYLIYGMGEKAIIQLAKALENNISGEHIRGLCYISKEPVPEYTTLPSYEDVKKSKTSFTKMFHIFYKNNDPKTATGLCQKHGARYLIQNPPANHLSQSELDEIHEFDFERAIHPFYRKEGKVKALDTIQFSMTTHQGCYGECNFCAISVHQGRTVRWRSQDSIINEAKMIAQRPDFKGTITDAGGPTANMYGFECKKKLQKGSCQDKRCLFPNICKQLKPNHSHLISLLSELKKIKGVKNVFTASGIRYDLIFADLQHGRKYLKQVVLKHVSGQLKIAPEHTEDEILELMGKPGTKQLIQFKKEFDALTRQSGKNQFLTYYMIAAHPGCTDDNMKNLKRFCNNVLKTSPEQVQIFTPTPSTYSSLMYYTGKNPFNGGKLFTEKNLVKSEKQKQIVTNRKWK